MIERFMKQAQAAGAECVAVAGRREAIEAVLAALMEEGVANEPGRWAVWADAKALSPEERRRISERLPGVRYDFTAKAASHALAGITLMDWGVARTGTLVGDSSAVERRLASTLPPVHIAILPAGRVVEDMAEALSRFDVRRSPYIATITGPSRTADIERVLTIGVHGPRRLLIVVVESSDGGGEAG